MRILIAECEIDYEGRARSTLSIGERVIIIKGDNTVLIHTEGGLKPINYMVASSSIEFFPNIVEFNTIIARRKKPHSETITIHINNLFFDSKISLKDDKNFILSGSEKDLQDFIFDNPDWVEEGFTILEKEFNSSAGAVDLLGIDKRGVYTLIELKRVKGSQAAVGQLRRYYDSLISEYKELRCILVADGISAPALNTLNNYGFEFLNTPERSNS